jgi:hypothetical protein
MPRKINGPWIQVVGVVLDRMRMGQTKEALPGVQLQGWSEAFSMFVPLNIVLASLAGAHLPGYRSRPTQRDGAGYGGYATGDVGC